MTFYYNWNAQQIARFDRAWQAMQNPNGKFGWGDVFPPPTSLQDVAKAAAKAAFKVMVGTVTDATVVTMVYKAHEFLTREIADGASLRDALSDLLNQGHWQLLGASMSEEEIYTLIMTLERITYDRLSLNRDWNTPGLAKWLTLSNSRSTVARAGSRTPSRARRRAA